MRYQWPAINPWGDAPSNPCRRANRRTPEPSQDRDPMQDAVEIPSPAGAISLRPERDARFDIIELGGRPIGRIVVDRPGTMVHIVDQAIVPELRNRGIGSAIMRALMDEARTARLPVRLKVASSNDPSLRLYKRLGFAPIETVPLYIEMEWNPAAGAT
jgi:ribosomal protein S18 acetylase RimI-like enzyme